MFINELALLTQCPIILILIVSRSIFIQGLFTLTFNTNIVNICSKKVTIQIWYGYRIANTHQTINEINTIIDN